MSLNDNQPTDQNPQENQGETKPQMPRRRPPRFGPGGKPTGQAPQQPQAAPGSEPLGPGIEALNQYSKVDKVIGVVSGKGGVGKSMTTALLAIALQRQGKRVAIMDADLTGPSIPRMFGLHGMATGNQDGIFPRETESGIPVMSINLLLQDEGEPVVWRGPVLAGVVKQFWTDVIWDEIDYMVVDLPPGTGDVPLTVYQSIPVDGTVIVTTPQSLVNMVVTKSVKMAEKMNVPVLGLIENMSYFQAPDTGNIYEVFGPSHINEIASQHDLEVLAKLPIDPRVTALSDSGKIEGVTEIWPGERFDELAKNLIDKVEKAGK